MSGNSPTRVAVSGAGGRMGKTILRLAEASPDLQVVAALEAAGHPTVGEDSGQLAGVAANGVPVTDDARAAFGDADVVIEFTLPGPSLDHLRVAAEMQCAAVLGTTGFNEEEQAELNGLSQRIPLLRASNMSLGITVLTEVVEDVARRLGAGFDIELVETHHRKKKDAPSGTALTLGEAAARGRGANLDKWANHGRSGIVGERPDDEIGIMALRGGDVVGDHTVYFYGIGERLELTHRAHSREAFASGAVQAAHWLAGRPAGLYSIRDVLFGTA